MDAAQLLYTHIKTSIFQAYLVLEWSPDDGEYCFFYSCQTCEREYNEAVKFWPDLASDWPKQPSARVGWFARRTIAEAGLLWVQDIVLAISSLRSHCDDHGPLSAQECHSLLIESLVEWHGFEPKGLMTERMDVLSRLEAEYELFVSRLPNESKNAAEPKGANEKKSKVVLTVSKWEDLSIGLASNSEFYAIHSPVEIGSFFPKAQSIELKIPKRGMLRELLTLFANSHQDTAVPLVDCLSSLNLLPQQLRS